MDLSLNIKRTNHDNGTEPGGADQSDQGDHETKEGIGGLFKLFRGQIKLLSPLFTLYWFLP